MLIKFLDPETLAYMSLMPISLQMVMIARWQWRPYPGEKIKYKLALRDYL